MLLTQDRRRARIRLTFFNHDFSHIVAHICSDRALSFADNSGGITRLSAENRHFAVIFFLKLVQPAVFAQTHTDNHRAACFLVIRENLNRLYRKSRFGIVYYARIPFFGGFHREIRNIIVIAFPKNTSGSVNNCREITFGFL